MTITKTRIRACKAKNPSTCRYHGNPNQVGSIFATPEMYKTIPSQINMDEEKFDDMNYIAASTGYLKPLPEKEIKALSHYVQSGYDEINSALYGNTPMSSEIEEYVFHLDSALTKASQAPPVLWRNLSGFNLPTKFLNEKHKVGDTISFPGYLSTSQTPSAIMHMANDTTWYMRETPADELEHDPNFEYRIIPPASYTSAPARNVMFMIKTRTAAPVSVLRGHVAEQEWLVPRGKTFKVTAIHNDRLLTGDSMSNGTRANVFVLEEI